MEGLSKSAPRVQAGGAGALAQEYFDIPHESAVNLMLEMTAYPITTDEWFLRGQLRQIQKFQHTYPFGVMCQFCHAPAYKEDGFICKTCRGDLAA